MNTTPKRTDSGFDEEVQERHAEMVSKLVKDPREILEDILANDIYQDLDLLHSVLGISGEAGELVDAIKKHVIYNKPLDRENVIEELGDMEFYLEQLRQAVGVTREETLQANINKLAKRYPNFQYTNQRAHERTDKQPEAVDSGFDIQQPDAKSCQ